MTANTLSLSVPRHRAGVPLIVVSLLLCSIVEHSFAQASAVGAADAMPAATLSGAGLRKLFEEGNTLFRSALDKAKTDKAASSALFRDAAAAWRTIALEGHIHNARLETNIANASLLAGDLPRAIAAFRRGQALDPFDATIRNGLTAARRAAGTEALAPGAAPVASPDAAAQGGLRGSFRRIGAFLAFAAHRTLLYLPERGLLWAAAACYLMAFSLAGLRVLEIGRVPRWAAAALFLAALLSAGPLVARDLAATPEGVIVGPGLTARNGPADLYDAAFKEPLAPGLEVRVEEQRPGWLKIRLGDGRIGWIPAAGIEPI